MCNYVIPLFIQTAGPLASLPPVHILNDVGYTLYNYNKIIKLPRYVLSFILCHLKSIGSRKHDH